MQPPIVTVTLLSAYPNLQPLAVVQVNPRVVALAVDSQLGGFGRCRVGLLPIGAATPGMVYPYLPDPVPASDGVHVIVSMGGAVLFEGVVVTVAPNNRGFEAQGYGLWAGQWGCVTQGGATMVTSGVIAREAIRAVAWWQQGELTDPGVLHAWDDAIDRTAGDVLQQLCDEGGTSGGEWVPWLFTVYEERVARFMPQVLPSQTDYVWSYDPETMEVGWDYSNIVDAVKVVYDEGGVRRVAGPYYRGGVDRTSRYLRMLTLTGTTVADGAVALAQTTLKRRSVATISGSVRFANWEGVGIRAYETFTLPGYGGGFITQAEHDLSSGESTVTLGEPIRTSPRGVVKAMNKALYSLSAKRDFVTGGRTV